MTAPTTVAPALLTSEQDAALALLADPGTAEARTRYVLPRQQARQAHRRIAKALVGAGRPDLVESDPMRSLASVAAQDRALTLHPADQHALIAVAGAFDVGNLAMTMVLAGLLHDSKAKYRARQVAAATA